MDHNTIFPLSSPSTPLLARPSIIIKKGWIHDDNDGNGPKSLGSPPSHYSQQQKENEGTQKIVLVVYHIYSKSALH